MSPKIIPKQNLQRGPLKQHMSINCIETSSEKSKYWNVGEALKYCKLVLNIRGMT